MHCRFNALIRRITTRPIKLIRCGAQRDFGRISHANPNRLNLVSQTSLGRMPRIARLIVFPEAFSSGDSSAIQQETEIGHTTGMKR